MNLKYSPCPNPKLTDIATGLTLEQVDQMLDETTPRNSAKWVPHSTYAAEMGLANKPGTEHAEMSEKFDV